MKPLIGNRDLKGINIHLSTILSKAHMAIDQCKYGVIAPEADSTARMPFGATLAQDDVPCRDTLTTKLLNAATFAVTVASVLDATLSFLMSHGIL